MHCVTLSFIFGGAFPLCPFWILSPISCGCALPFCWWGTWWAGQWLYLDHCCLFAPTPGLPALRPPGWTRLQLSIQTPEDKFRGQTLRTSLRTLKDKPFFDKCLLKYNWKRNSLLLFVYWCTCVFWYTGILEWTITQLHHTSVTCSFMPLHPSQNLACSGKSLEIPLQISFFN